MYGSNPKKFLSFREMQVYHQKLSELHLQFDREHGRESPNIWIFVNLYKQSQKDYWRVDFVEKIFEFLRYFEYFVPSLQNPA
jgi:hypothetical protein